MCPKQITEVMNHTSHTVRSKNALASPDALVKTCNPFHLTCVLWAKLLVKLFMTLRS